MRFFQYNNEVINLTQVANFDCKQKHIVYEGKDKDGFTLIAQMAYSHGFWEKEEMTMDTGIELGKFASINEALEVVKDILAGVYDLPTLQPVNVTTAPETAPKAEEEPTEQQPEDPKVLEDTKQGARELYSDPQTNVICTELGITKEKLFGEAQAVWGKCETWKLNRWQDYLTAIAHFHDRRGILYDRLKPNTEQTQQNDNGKAGKSQQGKSPF